MEIVFVTGNENKYKECAHILADTNIELKYCSYDLPEFQSDSEDCASMKCKAAFQYTKYTYNQEYPVIIEDVSLFFDAWDGLPGPYVKWFTSGPGVVKMEQMLSTFPDKNAEAWCIYAFKKSQEEEPVLFIGKRRGTIVPPRGENGFGFDSIFQVEGTNKTYGEMSFNEKSKLSHRTAALLQLRKYMENIK